MNRARYVTLVAMVFVCVHAGRTVALPTPETSLNTCQDKVRNEGKTFVKNTVGAIGNCLKKVAKDFIKDNAAAITAATSKGCVSDFRKINDTRLPPADKSIEQKFRDNVDKKCVPGFTPSQTHTFADIMGAGGGTLEDIKTTNIDAWCKHFGGDGSIGSVTEWQDCLVNSFNCEAAAAIAAQYPRSAEWLASLLSLANMPAVIPPASDMSKTTDAVGGATTISALVDPDGDSIPSPRCGGEGVACVTGCCYVENPPAGPPADVNCFEYTAPAASLAAFGGACVGPGIAGFQIKIAMPGPCIVSPPPVPGLACFGPPNKVIIPTDPTCP